MARGFRFDPPGLTAREELVWLLLRALGPRGAVLEPLDSGARAEVVGLAERLDLAARAAARAPAGALEREAGAAAAAALEREQVSAATVSLVVERVCREVARAAASLGVPALFLKGAALQLAGVVAPGSRSMGDVDVLVPRLSAEALRDGLVERGAAIVDAPVSEHQLQWLRHRSGLGIEVHTAIPGVRIDGSASASLEDVLQAGCCRPLGGFEGESWLPDLRLGVAHLVVHGIAQHGLKPESYPPARVLGDLQDLVPSAERWRGLAPGVMTWIERDVSEEELAACRDLVLSLASGADPGRLVEGSGLCGRYLRHVVVASTDPDYGRALRLRSLLSPVAADSSWRRLLRDALRTVWLTDTQIEQLYGRPRSSLGYWGCRLWRPFDLVGRAWRYGWAWLRHRASR